MAGCGASLFGNSSQFIKINGGDFVAIQGSDTRERLITSDLRMPYKQILKSRIILKIGQTNYLLNHLGLGDNATFLCIRATYDPKSVNEEDNYINWSYYDELTRVNSFGDMMVLTGNSTHRVPQLYLTNPSSKYPLRRPLITLISLSLHRRMRSVYSFSRTRQVATHYYPRLRSQHLRHMETSMWPISNPYK